MEYTESIYSGAITPFNPEYAQIEGQFIPFSELGTSQDARTANQIKDTSKHLNTGIKVVEIAAHSPEVFESMPKDHFKELNRLLKLTGSEATIHAPMVDAVGIVQNTWDETAQKGAERQLWEAVKRSHDLNPQGNTVVTMHASTAGLPFPEFKVKEGKKEELQSFLFIGPENKIGQIKKEEKFFPSPGGNKEFAIKNELAKENEEIWGQQLNNLNYYSQRGSEVIEHVKDSLEIPSKILGKNIRTFEEYEKAWNEIKNKEDKLPFEVKELQNPETLKKALAHGSIYVEDSYRNLRKLYDLTYKSAKEQNKKDVMERLDSYAKSITPFINDLNEVRKDALKLSQFSDKIEKGIELLDKPENRPLLLKPLREFAVEKSSETISNLALKSWKEFKDSAPIISVENHPAGQGLLTKGSDLKEVVEHARKRFENEAVEKKLMSREKAKKEAKKLIGATWDVGHINMLRKYGYEKEDIIQETEKIAPYVKHMHLSDNFGLDHTELPMGMGNVPFKEIMSKLNKEGFKGKKVAEALSWWQHFSEQGQHHAIIPTLQGINSPVYGMTNAPYWNQVQGISAGYLQFPMAYMPEKHFSMYGTGFSMLPEELGGQIPGTQSRFSGTPNA